LFGIRQVDFSVQIEDGAGRRFGTAGNRSVGMPGDDGMLIDTHAHPLVGIVALTACSRKIA